jgi:exosortase/archaeosortase family protein
VATMHAGPFESPSAAPGWRFSALALGWSIGLFALLRQPWVERVIVGALIDVQRTLALWYGAQPSGVVSITASCSGADAAALCLGATLAYPVAWRQRLAGALGGLLLILTINTARIGTLLTITPGTPRFELLHLYVFPALLVAAILVYVLTWSRAVDHRASAARTNRVAMFGGTALVLLLAEAALAPWAMTHAWLLRSSEWVATIARLGFDLIGVTAAGAGSLVTLGASSFRVTPECLLTPTLPVYLAAVVAAPLTKQQRWAGLAAALPFFFALAVVRVLVLAIPTTLVSTPVIVVHGFFQICLGIVVIAGASIIASRRDDGATPDASNERAPQVKRAIVACAGASVVAAVLGAGWAQMVELVASIAVRVVPHTQSVLHRPDDVQGALLLLPGFQLALLAGLWLAVGRGAAWRRLPGALLCLLATQLALLIVIGELRAHAGIEPHAIAIRAWAVSAPLVLFFLFHFDPRGIADTTRYRNFWSGVGQEFPSLTGASSTDFYLANEQRLIAETVPALRDLRVLKSDLWDEAKNTRILQWVAAQGAYVYGVDISEPIVAQAREAFGDQPLDAAVADIRRLPFADGMFDVVYSMGTIEHFAESEAAVIEMARVLRPGGRLILGVPNRHDPFLRPLLVALLFRCGWYAYGYEKSYSRRRLREMLERSHLQVVHESGILFIPGWLRMLDLALYTRWPALARLTAPFVGVFAWLDQRIPALRRHGYLLASTGVKRDGPAS